ncbi:MAG: AI-2E family transporter, partial [Syntrophaceae bacterium]
FCSLLVGSIDNVLRPWLVGKDTQLHELLIFFSTLGGISLFGIVGFIVGPIVAALFVTVWDIYAETFQGSSLKTGRQPPFPGEAAPPEGGG